MGIRFSCPNGHRLNVKGFLAGKRGICPQCGQRFVIPHQDGGIAEAVSGKRPSADGQEHLADPASQIHLAGSPPSTGIAGQEFIPVAAPATPSQPTTTPKHAIPSQAFPGSVTPAGIQPPSANQASVVRALPIATPVGAPSAEPADPIGAAPNAAWYVRPEAGGQFGPAQGDLMRQWVREGRVGASALVWRDGWADWQKASAVFPQLGAPSGEAGVATIAVPEMSIASRGGMSAGHRRKSNDATIALVIAMVLLAILLLVALAYVLSRQDFSRDKAARRPAVGLHIVASPSDRPQLEVRDGTA